MSTTTPPQMTELSQSPSDTCAIYLVQRRLSRSDKQRWRTVLACTQQQQQQVMTWIAAAELIDSAVMWRVVPRPDSA